MAIIYTYPLITPNLSDSILVTDAADKNKTKTATITSLKDTLGVIDTVSGVSPIQVAMNPSAHSATVSLSTVPVNLGGTNITNYSAGDIIYASSQGLEKLPIGNSGEVLKVSNSLPAWGTDSSGAEGSGFSGEVALWTGTGSTNILTGSMLKQVGSGATAKMVIGGNPNNGLTFENTGTAKPDVTLLPFDGSSGPNWEMRLPGPPQSGGQVMALPSTLGSSPYQLEWADVAIPNQSGQAGNFLTTDGSTMSWTQAQGGGTITGGGVQDRLAFYSGASAITSHPEIRTNSGGTLIVGDSSIATAAGNLFLENDPGVIGGRIRLYAKESTNPGTPRYVSIQASDNTTGVQSYDLYLPPTGAPGANRVPNTQGGGAELDWLTIDGTGLLVSNATLSLSSGAALTNLNGGTGTTYLRKDGTWDTLPSFSGNTVAGLVTYTNSTTATVSSDIKINPAVPQIIANNGIKANPTYSFESSTDSGMYCNAGGSVFISSNDTNSASFYDDKVQSNQLHEFNEYSGWRLGSSGDAYDCYESGSWTPAAYVPPGATVNPPTFSTAVGTFRKSGDIVHIAFRIIVSNASSGSLDMAISGLPYDANNYGSVGFAGAVTIIVNSGTQGSANLNPITGGVAPGFILLKSMGTNNALSTANWSPGITSNYTITGAGSYRAL